MTKVEAAYAILKEMQSPQHYKDILKIAIDRQLISTTSLTPGSALISSILQENDSRTNTGLLPRFDPLGNGYYGLTEWKPIGIERTIQEINLATRNVLRDRLGNMSPKGFEELIGEILIAIGFDEDTVEVSGRSGDGGIDVVGIMEIEGVARIDVAVQVKRYKANIASDKITALRGSLMPNQRGIFITTSKFTKQALQEANAIGKSPISLVDGEKVIDLLLRHKIGVKEQQHVIYEMDDSYWPEAPLARIEINIAENIIPNERAQIMYPLPIWAYFRNIRIDALLMADGRVEVDTQMFTSVSAAGIAVTGWKSCNGWGFWQFTHPIDDKEFYIDELRKSRES